MRVQGLSPWWGAGAKPLLGPGQSPGGLGQSPTFYRHKEARQMELLYWFESVRTPVLDVLMSLVTHLGEEIGRASCRERVEDRV